MVRIKHPLLSIAGHLSATVVVALGFMAYGCGDSASVNPVAELSSLTVDPGTLQPSFSGDTTQYKVDLSNNVTKVTITALPAVAGDTITINGQATTSRVIQLDQAGTTTPVSIVVSESGTNSRTYTVLVVRAGLTGNNSLQRLTISPGNLAPAFDPNVQAYSVDVANTVGSVSITPILQDSSATMTVNGQASASGLARTITLNSAGQPTTIPIVVIAPNGGAKSYLVTVSRGVSGSNSLRGLTVSPGTLNPSFSASRTSYTVNVSSGVDSVVVTPRLQDSAASMTMNGQSTNSEQARTIQLAAAGSTTPLFIIVTAQNGTQKTYTVGVNRATLGGNNNLSGLTVSPGDLEPDFRANTLTYSVDVGNNVNSVMVTPTRQDANATITVNGQTVSSGQAHPITLNGAGSSTAINIGVTAANGSQKTYSVTVTRAAAGGNNNLSALNVIPGSLNPAFRANRTRYSTTVGSAVTSVTVRATLQDSNATMTIEGQGTSSGQGRSINLGAAETSTDIEILVIAPSGSQKTYTIIVNRASAGDDDNNGGDNGGNGRGNGRDRGNGNNENNDD